MPCLFQRRRQGNIIVLTVISAIVLTILLCGAIKLALACHISQQVRNTIDNAAVNVAANAMVPGSAPDEHFRDCVDTNGLVTLATINRVLGKMLLINLNAESMRHAGQQGTSQASAQSAQHDAEKASQALSTTLKNQNTLMPYYGASISASTSPGNQYARVSVSPASNNGRPMFTGAFVHRGEESNIQIDKTALPEHVAFAQNSQAVVQTDGGTYVAGYANLTVNDYAVNLIPFRQREMTHLIANEEFDANSSAVSVSVPNCFRVRGDLYAGSVLDSAHMSSVSSAVANPNHTYKLAIPHAFIRIHLKDTPVTWLVNNQSVAQSTYKWYQPESQAKIKDYNVGCGKLDGSAMLSLEYVNAPGHSYMQAVPGDQAHQAALKVILQRIKEIDPTVDAKKLQTLLKLQLKPGVYDYAIYPVYATKDFTDPIMLCTSLDQMPGYLNKAAMPDGTAKSLGSEHLDIGPSQAFAKVQGAWQLSTKDVEVNGQVMWTPGTGYNQCLGMLEFDRTAKVSFTGSCGSAPPTPTPPTSTAPPPHSSPPAQGGNPPGPPSVRF